MLRYIVNGNSLLSVNVDLLCVIVSFLFEIQMIVLIVRLFFVV